MRNVVILSAVLALGALAGCVRGGEEAPAAVAGAPLPGPVAAPVAVVQDPLGDAREGNWDFARWVVPCASVPNSPVATPCAPGPPHGATGAAGVRPASPARDLLEVRFQETPATLEVAVDLAALDETLEGAVDRDAGRGTLYLVQVPAAPGCFVELSYFLWPMPDEVDRIPFAYWWCEGPDDAREDTAFATPCGFQDCGWGVPGAIEFGEPATVRWSLPRALLDGTALEARVEGAVGYAILIAQPYNASAEDGATTLEGPVHARVFAPDYVWYAFDTTEAGAPFAFATPPPEPRYATFPVRIVADDATPADGLARPDLRLLDYAVEELPDRLRLTATLAAVDERPRDHVLQLGLTLPGHALWAGYTASGGERQAFANLYEDFDASVSLPVAFRVTSGTPGAVEFEIARADLPDVPAGSLSGWLLAGTRETVVNETSAGQMTLQSEHWRWMDFLCCGPPVAFGTDGTSTGPAAHRLTGATGDARLPPDVVASSRARFDLQTLEVASTEPGEVRFTLGVADLSELDPPDGYDAVFYAVGVEHAAGRTMVGYYRGHDRPLGEFLCATDTTVLPEVPEDPVRSPDWSEIPGRVLVSTAGAGLSQGGQASAGTAAFVFAAPTSCFGLGSDARGLDVGALEAGSYLVRRATQRLPETVPARPVTTVDALPPAERPFGLVLAQAVVAPPSFWEAPFGIENGWDVIGAALAIVTVLATLGVFVRRRRLMRWYLDELVRIDRAYLADATARAKALVALRRRLHQDIVKHRVSDPEYIRDRLRSSLTSARLVTISDGFYGLPAPLALRLERMLDDGRMTPEESKLLEPIIERTRIPSKAKTLLIERLRSWVAEDGAWG